MSASGTQGGSSSRPYAAVLPIGMAVALLTSYLAAGPRTLPEADSGELAAIAMHGGIPHPPGYPLLVLLLQGFAHLAPQLGVSPALALSSYLLSCAAAMLLARTLIARGAAPLAACVATAAVFVSRNVFRASTSFEPFALNLLLAVSVLACCQALCRAAADGGGKRASVALGVTFGLGLCNHHSLATLAPLPLAVLLARPRLLPERLARIALGFLLGALPLLSLAWLRTQSGWIWGDWSDFFPQLAHHVLRCDYGTLTLSSGTSGHASYGPLRMLTTLPAVLSYAFVLPCALGAWAMWTRHPSRQTRSDGFSVGLAASFLTSGFVFPALFRLQGTALDHLIADRFLALPVLLLAFPIAEALARQGAQRWRVQALLVSALALHAALQWPESARVHHRWFEAHVRNVFDVLEDNAVLMVAGDDGYSGGLYGKHVLGRHDVTLVIEGLDAAWHRVQIADAVNHAVPGGASRPLYLLDVPATPRSRTVRTFPVGPLLRVLGPNEPMPAPALLFEKNRALFAGLRLPTREEIANADAWERDTLPYYARAWDTLAQRLQQQGDAELAASARAYRDTFTVEPTPNTR